MEKIKKIHDYLWEIPRSGRMLVPGRIYASRKMLKEIIEDKSIDQVVNVAHLPGIQKYSIAMPDIHLGYGFPIGGIAATDTEEGVISPGGVGYDINCGVRLMRTNLTEKDIRPKLRSLVEEHFKYIPAGPGVGGKVKLSDKDYRSFMREGVRWIIEKGWGREDDIEMTEDRGYIPGGNPEAVSRKAYERGRDQLGSLGSGNHFLEIDIVDRIDNPEVAGAFGLFKGQVCILIHSGSRGFGHQICTDYINTMIDYMHKHNIELPDKQLACAHIKSREGQDYLSAFSAAVIYAWMNRQIMMQLSRNALCKILKISETDLGGNLVYDVSHNIAKMENHHIRGSDKVVCVHRKGATRSFPKGHPGLPEKYKNFGQPVFIPGDMGRFSYVLVGEKKSMDETFGTCCHGAGRLMSRRKALKVGNAKKLIRELNEKGIEIMARGKRTIVEEMPEAYKLVEDVCDVVHNAGIASKVAKLRPVGVIKG